MHHRRLLAPVLWLAAATLSPAQTGTYFIRTLAGHSAGGDGGLATNALVPLPTKVAVDATGNVYVSEISGPIRRITPDGLITTIANAVSPYSLAPDNSNNLFIAQNGTCTITRLNLQTGNISTVAGDGVCRSGADGPAATTSFFVPETIAFDLQGRLLVGDASYRIRRIDLTSGTVTTIAGDGTSGGTIGDGGPAIKAQIGNPTDLSLDSKGDIFFADSTNCLVRRIEAATGIIRTIAGVAGACGFSGDGGPPLSAHLNGPRSIVAAPAGNVLFVGEPAAFVAGAGGRIRQINLDTNQITTYAGSGTLGVGGDGGPAIQAQLAWPWGLAFDLSGNLLEADYLASRLRRIDASGNISTFAGTNSDGGDGGPATAASLNGPDAAVPDGKGGFFIADSGNRKIRGVSGGLISTLAGTTIFAGSTGNGGLAKNAGLGFVNGMTADSAGNIYFTESAGTVRRITPGGVIGEVGSTSFNFPVSVAVDPTGLFLYVAEASGDRVDQVAIATGVATTFAGLGTPGAAGSAGNNGDGPATQRQLNGPSGVAVDGSGNVYVLDAQNYLIRRISPSTGSMATVAGNGQNASSGDGGKATAASITNLSGLAVDVNGNIFFSEGTKIRRVDAVTGIISTIAGTGVAGFSGDAGPALSATFNGATGLNVDALGNIYFADSGNRRIRVLSLPIAGPRIAAAIVAANFGAGLTITPGTWIEIYGEKLSPTTRSWAGSDFNGNQAPTSLDNVKVLVANQPAVIDFISPGQINAQVPDGIGTGNIAVQVVNPNGSSDPVVISAAVRAPALLAPPSFSSAGRYFVDALFTDGTFVGKPGLVAGAAFRPATAGDNIVLYGIGFGPGTPVVPSGTIATQTTSLPNFSVSIGGVNATVGYAGLAGGFVGLYQFNVVVPSGVTGDVLLSVSVNGTPVPQTLFLTVQ